MVNLSKLRPVFLRDLLAYLTRCHFVSTLESALRFFMCKVFKRLRPEFYLARNEVELFDRYSNSQILRIEYEHTSTPLPVHVEFYNSKHGVSLCNIRTCFSDETFTLDDDLEAAIADNFQWYKRMLRCREKTFFDGTLARLRCFSFCSRKNEVELCLQPVGYFTACKSHRCLDAPLNDTGDTIRRRVHANGLEDLDNSRLANSLGYSTLLFTADYKLIIQRRSERVVAFGSSWGPASSGAFDAEDFRNRGKGASFPFLRETDEELRIGYDDIIAGSVRFLGITRELYRGGKPEMFFLAQTKLAEEAIRKRRKDARDKWESSSLEFSSFSDSVFDTELSDHQKHRFRTDMTKLLDKYKCMKDMSDPLLSALALWQNDVLSRPLPP